MSEDYTPSLGELFGMTVENDLRDEVARLTRERDAALEALRELARDLEKAVQRERREGEPMTSEQPTYEWRMEYWAPGAGQWNERYLGRDEAEARRWAAFYSNDYATRIERRQVGPWEKVEQ